MACRCLSTQCTCFTSTNVQILTGDAEAWGLQLACEKLQAIPTVAALLQLLLALLQLACEKLQAIPFGDANSRSPLSLLALVVQKYKS